MHGLKYILKIKIHKKIYFLLILMGNGEYQCSNSASKQGYVLKVSHPRCVVKIQVREENPILYSHKTQLNIKLRLL